MAIKIYDKFSPFANPSDENYPHGSIKNDTMIGAEDGTPLDAAWGNDYVGFDAALLAAAGMTPSGVADTAVNSQRLQALLKIIDSRHVHITDSVVAPGAGGISYRIYSNGTIDMWGESQATGSVPKAITLPFPVVNLTNKVTFGYRQNPGTLPNMFSTTAILSTTGTSFTVSQGLSNGTYTSNAFNWLIMGAELSGV